MITVLKHTSLNWKGETREEQKKDYILKSFVINELIEILIKSL